MAKKNLTEEEQLELNEKLWYASRDGQVDVVIHLISENANVDYVDPTFGRTVLGIAAFRGHDEVISTLLNHDADIEKKDNVSGMTAFLMACSGGHIGSLVLLADRGAQVKATDERGRSGVHFACRDGHVDVLKYLLEKGLNLQDTDNDGNTGLYWACYFGHLDVLQFLLTQGLSLHTPNKQGQTPLMILKEKGSPFDKKRQECLDYLKEQIDTEESSSSAGHDVSESKPDKDKESSSATFTGLSRDKAKDDEKMAQLVHTQIEEQGEMRLKNVKGILTGPPGVGKTITVKRLTGKIRNITLDGPSKSTGIDEPLTFQLYHDTEKKSIVIGEQWSPLTIDQQLGAVFHCMSQSSLKYTEAISGQAHFFLEEETTSTSQQSDEPVSRQLKPFHPQSRVSLDKYFGLLQEFIRQSKWDEAQALLIDVQDLTLFHVIDTGGQPEFFEILPLLLRGPCFSLIFLNLAHSLKEPFSVTYRHTPTSHSVVEYKSTYTQLEMIHMLLASLHSLNYEHDCPQRSAAFLIGTHLDQAKLADIQQIAKEIEDSLRGKSFFDEDILAKYYLLESKVCSFLFALDNQNGDEKEISKLREILTELIQSIFPSESLPTSWGVFHLMLRHKCEEKGLCTLDESIELGKACGLRKEGEVIIALRFFHTRFGTILYYEEVESLKSLVICDLNLLFKPITRLVGESFGANPRKQETARKIRRTGEISYNFLEQICKENDPLQRIPTEAIVDLLKYHNIVSEISNGDKRLFMSCLLQPSPPEESGNGTPVDQASLLFTFHPHGYQPICLFHILTSKLLQTKEFHLDKTRYRNKISFLYGNAEVEIHSNVSFLQVCVKNCSKHRYALLRNALHKKLIKIVAEVPHMKGTEIKISFFCPHDSHVDKSPRIATLHRCEASLEEEPSWLLLCENCENHRTARLEAHHEVWLMDVDTGDEEFDRREFQLPCVQKTVEVCAKSRSAEGVSKTLSVGTIPVLRHEVLMFLKKNSARWNLFALELQVPDDTRDQLRGKSMSDVEKLDEVLRKWMESECRPVTWNTILDVLNKLEMRDLARDVLEFLESSQAIGNDHSKAEEVKANESHSRRKCIVL